MAWIASLVMSLLILAQYSAPGEQEEGLQARDNDDVDDVTPPTRNED